MRTDAYIDGNSSRSLFALDSTVNTTVRLLTATSVSSTQNALDVNIAMGGGAVGTTFVIGQKKITASAVQLSTNTLTNGVIFTAKSTNAGNVFIGGSGVTTTADGTGNGYILEPGNSVSAAVNNLNLFYVIGTLNDVLSWIGS